MVLGALALQAFALFDDVFEALVKVAALADVEEHLGGEAVREEAAGVFGAGHECMIALYRQRARGSASHKFYFVNKGHFPRKTVGSPSTVPGMTRQRGRLATRRVVVAHSGPGAPRG